MPLLVEIGVIRMCFFACCSLQPPQGIPGCGEGLGPGAEAISHTVNVSGYMCIFVVLLDCYCGSGGGVGVLTSILVP